MEIKNIKISNFRSISDIEIKIEEIANKKCSIFLGKNETGKSNILKAISLLDPEVSFDYETDCNKSAKKTKKNIEIEFELDVKDSSYKQEISEIGFPKALEKKLKIRNIQRKINIYSDNKRKDFVWIWLTEDDIFLKYFFNKSNNKIIPRVLTYTGKETVTKENIKELVGEQYQLLTKDIIEDIIEDQLYDTINKKIPKVIIWRPSDKFMINESINLSSFATDSSISIPLRNIFRIAGIDNIEDSINLISHDNTEERRELEELLSNSITEYINRIWPEHKINLIIDIENMHCKVLIEDKDDRKPKYKMEQRSDGFKQFISILLSLSIESNTEQLKDKIILLDEPEVHLHPSGIRYLRDELLNISNNNIVLVSSHSIYMVDKLNINRHFKVDKEKSITNIKQIDKNNPYEEEVIYEALGTSVYEHIKPNMLVFEGKTDKDIFDKFTQKFKTDFKPVNLGTISADGVEKIHHYTKFIDGKFVKGFILTDSDTAGIKVKEQIKIDNKSFTTKNTFEINDIFNTKIASTLEDLYPQDVVIKVIKDKFNIDIELNNEPIIKQLEKKNRSLKGKLNVKEIKGLLVNYILTDINKLTKAQTKTKYPDYFKFSEILNTKLKK